MHELSVKFLANLNSAGLPPVTLELKVGAPVMLLQNMHPQVELCNGTCMIITHLHHLCIEASILSGQFAGQRHILYRINLIMQEGDYPWIIIRKQFPVCLCFAIIINKSQEQSLSVVGLNVCCQYFSHSQLYVICLKSQTLNVCIYWKTLMHRGKFRMLCIQKSFLNIMNFILTRCFMYAFWFNSYVTV